MITTLYLSVRVRNIVMSGDIDNTKSINLVIIQIAFLLVVMATEMMDFSLNLVSAPPQTRSVFYTRQLFGSKENSNLDSFSG